MRYSRGRGRRDRYSGPSRRLRAAVAEGRLRSRSSPRRYSYRPHVGSPGARVSCIETVPAEPESRTAQPTPGAGVTRSLTRRWPSFRDGADRGVVMISRPGRRTDLINRTRSVPDHGTSVAARSVRAGSRKRGDGAGRLRGRRVHHTEKSIVVPSSISISIAPTVRRYSVAFPVPPAARVAGSSSSASTSRFTFR